MPMKNQLTNEELQEAWEAVRAVGGNVTAAARNLGIPRRTLADRYRVAQDRGFVAQKKKAEDASKRVKALEKLVEQQKQRIELLTASKFKIPKQRKGGRKGSFYTRLVVPDTHGSVADEGAISAMFADLENIGRDVKEIVLLGDHVNCGGFLAQHHTIGYVAELGEVSFEDDINATNQHLDRIQELCPKAEIHYLEGNHERRIERWCVTQALGHKGNSEYLKKLFSIRQVLNLDKRGINLYEQGVFYHGCRIPATIKLGHCYFTHGNRTGKNPASLMLSDFGSNVVFGHCHILCMSSTRTVDDGEMGAWCPGTLSKLQPLWNHTQITRWGHGYGVQTVHASSGDFLHVNVPIIEGKSYLLPLTSQAT